jgi:hypothetical protein
MRLLHLDAREASWAVLARSLLNLKALSETVAVYAYVSIPADFAPEAKRVISHLRLDDHCWLERPPDDETRHVQLIDLANASDRWAQIG